MEERKRENQLFYSELAGTHDVRYNRELGGLVILPQLEESPQDEVATEDNPFVD